MKTKILITLMFVANLIFAQGPYFNYKALITDNSGNALSNHSVNIRFTIYNDDPTNGGTVEYQETHSLQTDANGIVIAEIGGGTSTGGNQIDDLNWASNLKYLKTEFDIGDGNGYQEIDTKQFYLMPYAYAARDAYNAQQVPYSGITNKPAWLADGDNDNQTLSVNGNQLTISNGNTVTLPTGSGGDQWGSQVVQSDASLSGNGTSGSPLSVNTSSSAFNGWDKNASDDFSGNFNDLSNKPLTWKIIGGNNPSTSNTDDIFRTGKVVIGATSLYTQGHQKLYINNSDSGGQLGIVNRVSGGGSGLKTALYNNVNNAGTGDQTGVLNLVRNSNNGIQTGTYNDMQLGGIGDIRGTYNKLSGNSDAKHFGVKNELSGTGNGINYGVYNDITNTGSEEHIGNYNKLSGSGSGMQFGVYTFINNTGNQNHYGSYSLLAGTGNGYQIGTANQISNSGSGFKFGSYNFIDPTSGGDHHIAVYGEALKAGNNIYAGYFNGNVKVTKKLKADDSGDADMKAYIYGDIDTSGIAQAGSSDGFTPHHNTNGQYTINFTNQPGNTNYVVIVSITGNSAGFTRVMKYSDRFVVYTFNTNGQQNNRRFNFVVYKK